MSPRKPTPLLTSFNNGKLLKKNWKKRYQNYGETTVTLWENLHHHMHITQKIRKLKFLLPFICLSKRDMHTPRHLCGGQRTAGVVPPSTLWGLGIELRLSDLEKITLTLWTMWPTPTLRKCSPKSSKLELKQLRKKFEYSDIYNENKCNQKLWGVLQIHTYVLWLIGNRKGTMLELKGAQIPQTAKWSEWDN